MKLKVQQQREADGGFSVSIPAMPGCHSQGDNHDDALANIREAAELWLEVQEEKATRNGLVLGQLEEIEL